jgi:hypothetical protein
MTTKYLHNCISFPSDLLDDKHVKEVKRRLVECQDNHETCSRQEPPSLPVRVVDVGSTDADIKLHISETDEKASYIALSYCWGGAQQIRTTMDTLETKMGGIPFTHLSRTIKDAIKVTRKLGIQYLWVDALCIIQDSQDDKASQITNMGKIYRNATLTIAVSGAESAQTGFLDATPTYRGFELPFLLPGGIQGHVVATPCSYSYHKPDWPLSTRAWTLQECVLSPRLLSFSDGEVRWRCQSVDLLPLFCSPFNYGPNYMPPRFPLGVTDNVAGVSHSTDVDSSVQRERDRETRLIQDQFWGNIVVDFSRRRATLREDRLPALAGIADQLEVVWKDTYLAGVWKSRLVGNLAWIASNAKIPSQTDPYLAPSWSWLSIEDSEIVFNLMESTDAEVLACSAEPLYHSARLGQLKGGTLILRAAVASAPIEVVELLDHGDTYKPLIDQQGLYMNLGFDILGMGVGLILIPKAEGVFTRAGYFCWKSGDPPYHIYHDFSTVERRVVTII